jgi:hypothetical protein
MCTVSFIHLKDQVFLTSSRDEKVYRKRAVPPAIHHLNGWNLIYPKDAAAGGTWTALKENGGAAALLNGGFISHKSNPPYRKSRGILFLEILSAKYPAWAFSKIDLTNIEPFTLVHFEGKSLYEFRWDGLQRYCRQLSTSRPRIWSSATLYDAVIHKKREQWFAKFLNGIPNPTQQDILNFHLFGGDGTGRNDLRMERDGVYATVSIASILLNADHAVMKYQDLVENTKSELKMELFEKAVVK